MDRVKDYLSAVSSLLMEAPEEEIRKVAELLLDAYSTGRQVFIMGNGGSAATASHFACDLQKTMGLLGEKKFKVMALTDSTPLMTAWANDFEYADIFARQLATWLAPGDLVIGISGSGNSANIMKAIEYANNQSAVTIGMSGFNGGQLAQSARYNIIIQSDNMQHIEDVHMVLAHLIFRYLLEVNNDCQSVESINGIAA